MTPAINRLLHLGRRRPEPEAPPAPAPTVDVDAMALESATLAPRLLEPAAIFRQVLFDPTEFTPPWLRPRPTPATSTPSAPVGDETTVASAAPTDEPKPAKRPRRAKATGAPATNRTRSKRTAKADHDPT
ncbi:MAG TPA: hypothetical protein VNM34_06035 [Verrucomicrobiae bacterium]|nr:hypothetical protein [Verrucomicrobiae bacterium]